MFRPLLALVLALGTMGPLQSHLHPGAFAAVGSFGEDGWSPRSTDGHVGRDANGSLDASLENVDGNLTCPCAVGILLPPGRGEVWVTWDGAASGPKDPRLAGAGGLEWQGGLFHDGVLFRVHGEAGPFVVSIDEPGPIRIEAGAHASSSQRPNLLPIVPAHLGESVPGRRGLAVDGCLDVDERDAGSSCLRFTSAVANTGAAALELRHTESGVAMQRVDGSWMPAGAATFHDAHRHVHYEELVSFALFAVADDGSRAAEAWTGGKTGFCLVDWLALRGSENGPSPRFYTTASCAAPGGTMGVGPGHADVYRWFLPEQLLDSTGLPDGLYELVIRVDPNGLLHQSERRDDAASLRLRFEDGRAEVVSERGLFRFVDL